MIKLMLGIAVGIFLGIGGCLIWFVWYFNRRGWW